MNAVQVFDFKGASLRTVKVDGEPWFVAADVCRAVNIDPTAIRKLEDEEKGLHLMQTPGGPQNISVVSESGLYALIMRSRKPEARAFRRWVTSVVLPAIRKDGSYVMGEEKVTSGEIGEDELMARAMVAAGNKIARLQGRIVQDAPKVTFYDTYTKPRGNMRFKEFSQHLGVSMREFRAFLSPEYVRVTSDDKHARNHSYTMQDKYKQRGWHIVGCGKSRSVLLFTPEGQRAITELFRAWQSGREQVETLPCPQHAQGEFSYVH